MLGRRSGGMRRCRGAGLMALAAVLLGVAADTDRVQQEPWAETTEGTGLNLTCSHPEIAADSTRWYRQFPGQAPQLVATAVLGTKPMLEPEGSLSMSSDGRSSAMWLGRPGRGDAAVYYCALGRNTQSGAYAPSFGSGTRLIVRPQVTPSPSVYRLTSKDDQDLEMCLITDYSPDKLTVNSAEQHTSAVVGVAKEGSPEESSYLSTYWARRDQLQCAASHEGFGELEGDDPESGASAVCVTGMSLNFMTNEHLNTMSLSQLGLKVVLMKGVIFNVLMTMLLWKKKKD